ncbi:MAG: diacylglycerol kinase family protein [Taibaiella sp.]|nr:diacylglycerol kinase family protein [Taibaiella sp.]
MPGFIKNVQFASHGIRVFFKTEKNGKIQGIIAVLVIISGIFLKISRTEWLFILGFIAMIISLEMLNSAIEKICNMISAEYHPQIKIIKDISAAAVLFAAVIAAVAGLIIFIPYLLPLINGRTI